MDSASTLLITATFLEDADAWSLACASKSLFSQRLSFCRITFRDAVCYTIENYNIALPNNALFRRLVVGLYRPCTTCPPALHFNLQRLERPLLSSFPTSLQELILVDILDADGLAGRENVLPVSLRTLTLDRYGFEEGLMYMPLAKLTNLTSLVLHGSGIEITSLPASLRCMELHMSRHPCAEHHHSQMRFWHPIRVRADTFTSCQNLQELRMIGSKVICGDMFVLPRSLEILYFSSDADADVLLPHTSDGRPDLSALRELHYAVRSFGLPFEDKHPQSMLNVFAQFPNMPNLREMDLWACPTDLPIGEDHLDLRKYTSLEIVRCQMSPKSFRLGTPRTAVLLLPPSVMILDTHMQTFLATTPVTQLTQLVLRKLWGEEDGEEHPLSLLVNMFPSGPGAVAQCFAPKLQVLHLASSWVYMHRLAPWLPVESTTKWSNSFRHTASISNPCFVREKGASDLDAVWNLFYTCDGCDFAETKCEPRGRVNFVGHRFRGEDLTPRCKHSESLGPMLCSSCELCAYCVEDKKLGRDQPLVLATQRRALKRKRFL
jgi:hypothetical protein